METTAVPKFIALFQFLLLLGGCNIGGTTYSDRMSVDGHHTLNSRARAQAGIAHFTCLASASGRCHYTLFADDAADNCKVGARAAGTTRQCPSAPLQQFDVAAGDSREIAGLPGFRLCVSVDDQPLGADCKRPGEQFEPHVAATPSG